MVAWLLFERPDTRAGSSNSVVSQKRGPTTLPKGAGARCYRRSCRGRGGPPRRLLPLPLLLLLLLPLRVFPLIAAHLCPLG